jgi:Bacterial Ig-like domain
MEKIMDNRKTFCRRMTGLGWVVLVAGICAVILGAFKQNTAVAKSEPGAPPKIVKTSPEIGETDVDPELTEITVTFDQDMAEGMSWTGGKPDYPTVQPGKQSSWRDKRTCVLPVKLSQGKYYRVGINSPSFQNFQSISGVPVEPTAIFFTTKGASQELKNKVKKPEIVSMTPANKAKDVDPKIKALRVTFNVPMSEGASFTGGGDHFPKIPEGKHAAWSKDHKTCTLPVELKPDWEYRFGLNSPSYKNFASATGIPLEPVEYTFKTKK